MRAHDGSKFNNSGIHKHGSYAFFPGTGPDGKFCMSCDLLTPGKGGFRCAKFREITGRWGHPINEGTPSCKYYVLKEKKNDPWRTLQQRKVETSDEETGHESGD